MVVRRDFPKLKEVDSRRSVARARQGHRARWSSRSDQVVLDMRKKRGTRRRNPPSPSWRIGIIHIPAFQMRDARMPARSHFLDRSPTCDAESETHRADEMTVRAS